MDDKAKREMIERDAGEERLKPDWEVDPMAAMICGSSFSMLSSGIAIPGINMNDIEEDDKEKRK